MSVAADDKQADKPKRPATKLVARQLKYVGCFLLQGDDGQQVVMQLHDSYKLVNFALLADEALNLYHDLNDILPTSKPE